MPSIDIDYGRSKGRSLASLSSSPNSPRRRLLLSRIECHPSAIRPAVEPLSGAEQVTVNPQPYFVPSTASALEVLTNVAIQDFLAQDAEFYDLPCHPASIPSLSSVSDSWDTFDFFNPFARDDYSDSDWEDMEEGTADDALQSPPKPTGSSNQFRGLGIAFLPSFVHINKEIRPISSVVGVNFGKTRPDSHPGEDHGDGLEAIVIPVSPFPHPHRLSTIIEEDENEEFSRPERDSEDDDETSDTETIRPSGILARPRLSADARIVWRC
jgi:hypothetical protein